MKKFKSYSQSFINTAIVIKVLLRQVVQSPATLPSTGKKAVALIVSLAPDLVITSREFKLLTLLVLIHAKFIETKKFVTYSFLMREMKIGYLELVGLLKELGIYDENNGDSPTDCLVANDGDDTPPAGFVTCGNPHREHLTPEQYVEYADQMMERYCIHYRVIRRVVARTYKTVTGKTENLVPLNRFIKHNPNVKLTHSHRRYIEQDGILTQVA